MKIVKKLSTNFKSDLVQAPQGSGNAVVKARSNLIRDQYMPNHIPTVTLP